MIHLTESDVRFAQDAIAALEILQAIRRDVPSLHQRICWPCQIVHWHADNSGSWVACPDCESMDTRRVKDPHHGS